MKHISAEKLPHFVITLNSFSGYVVVGFVGRKRKVSGVVEEMINELEKIINCSLPRLISFHWNNVK